jgi:hypothetical protein
VRVSALEETSKSQPVFSKSQLANTDVNLEIGQKGQDNSTVSMDYHVLSSSLTRYIRCGSHEDNTYPDKVDKSEFSNRTGMSMVSRYHA